MQGTKLQRWLIAAALSGAGCAPAAGGPELGAGPGGKGDFIGTENTGDICDRWEGQTEFCSAAEHGPIMPFMRGGGLEAATADAAPTREVIESDIVRKFETESGTYLAILNTYRGLHMVDITNPDAAEVIDRQALYGTPHEMFVEDGHAFVMLNAMDEETGAWKSRVRVFDVENPMAVGVVGEDLELDERIVGARLVRADDGSSSVLYIATQSYGDYWMRYENNRSKITVRSINVTDPMGGMTFEDERSFEGRGQVVHVAADDHGAHFFVAYQPLDQDWQTRTTSIQHLDISDPTGRIDVGRVEQVQGRFEWAQRRAEAQMYYQDGYLRTATQAWTQDGSRSWVTSIKVLDAGSSMMRVSKEIPLVDTSGSLDQRIRATRFAGRYGFVFHMEQIDPLTVIDFGTPAEPQILGQLEIPGWINDIQWRDTDGDGEADLLIGLGVDSADGRDLAVVAFDAESIEVIDRVVVKNPNGYSWTQANYDDRVMSIMDEEKLIALPVNGYFIDEMNNYVPRNFLQLFGFDKEACFGPSTRIDSCLFARGTIENMGTAKRTLPVEADEDKRLVSFDDTKLAVIDHEGDEPITHQIELARNVGDFKVVGNFGVQLVSAQDAYRPVREGETRKMAELRVVPASQPDAIGDGVVTKIELQNPAGQLFRLGRELVVHLGSSADYQKGLLQVFQVGARGLIDTVYEGEIPRSGYSNWNGFGPARMSVWMPPATADAVLMGETLAVFTFNEENEEPGSWLRLYDLSNPAAGVQTIHKLHIGPETISDMTAVDGELYVSTYTYMERAADAPADDAPAEDAAAEVLPPGRIPGFQATRTVQHWLRKIDVERIDDANVRVDVSNRVNVPGEFVTKKSYDGTDYIFTMDRLANEDGRTAFDALEFTERKDWEALAQGEIRWELTASLTDVYGADLIQNSGKVFVHGEHAFFAENWRPVYRGPVVLEDGEEADEMPAPIEPEPARLYALDLSNPTFDAIELTGEVAMADTGHHEVIGIEQVGGRVYAGVRMGYGRLGVYDLTHPTSMRLADVFLVSGWFDKYDVAGGKLYLPQGMAGVEALPR